MDSMLFFVFQFFFSFLIRAAIGLFFHDSITGFFLSLMNMQHIYRKIRDVDDDDSNFFFLT
jgi:hypothetical protein